MALLVSTLLFVLLTTASANPAGFRQHHDADLSDEDLHQGWLDIFMDSHYTAVRSSSSESQSLSSEELSSSEEILDTVAPPTDRPLAETPAPPVTMTTVGVTPTVTMGTDLPIVDNNATTVLGQTTTTPCPTTGCVTVEIPTQVPVTDNRGDS